MKKRRRSPPVYLIAPIIAMAALHFLLPGMKLLRFPWSLIGIVPFGLGGIFILAAVISFKMRRTTVESFEESSVLVTDGVFRVTRNPMCLGFELMLLGIALFMGSLTPFLVVPVFALLMDVIVIRAEEGMLEEKFGELWLAYRNKVRRWI